MKVTGRYSVKPYRCTTCGREEQHGTNHWGDIYPHCRHCGTITVFECLEPVPEGYGVPEKWKICRLGDLVDIKGVGA